MERRKRDEFFFTGEANEKAGNVEHVGGEPRLVVVHSVLLARLVPHDIEQDVNRRLCVRGSRTIPATRESLCVST